MLAPGQKDADGRALARGAVDPDAAVVGLDNLPGDAHAEAEPADRAVAAVGAVKLVKIV